MNKTNFILKVTIILWIIIFIFSLVCFTFSTENKVKTKNYKEAAFEGKEFEILFIEQFKNLSLNKMNANKNEKIIFYELTNEERWLVESIVAGEAGIEPYWGKVGVASCILNACLIEDKRPEEIQTMYGYAGWKPIEEFESECMIAYGNTDLADEVRDAASQVFDDGEVLNNEILWFCSGYSKWHESQRFIVEIGGHRFFAPWN